mmetsp:Transcript_15470/g.47905  ORF Transcript_15470/g.47905 Transcript_15470/m.47905 type:complete len:240 (-) Transcript_15470:208-927(-)
MTGTAATPPAAKATREYSDEPNAPGPGDSKLRLVTFSSSSAPCLSSVQTFGFPGSHLAADPKSPSPYAPAAARCSASKPRSTTTCAPSPYSINRVSYVSAAGATARRPAETVASGPSGSVRPATVRFTRQRPLNGVIGYSTSGGPRPGRLAAPLRMSSAGASAARDGCVIRSVGAAARSRRRVASPTSTRRPDVGTAAGVRRRVASVTRRADVGVGSRGGARPEQQMARSSSGRARMGN